MGCLAYAIYERLTAIIESAQNLMLEWPPPVAVFY